MKQDHPRQPQDVVQDSQQDRPQDSLDRLTVAQAADRLGITQDAVRKRIARGTIRHDKDYEGRIFVYLDTFERESKTDQDNYTRSLEDQIDFLRRELERKDAIIMTMAQRIPELEAPTEPRKSDISASEERGEGDVPPEQEQRRSWLYRFFFGP